MIRALVYLTVVSWVVSPNHWPVTNWLLDRIGAPR